MMTGPPRKEAPQKVVSENPESWLEWRDHAERPLAGYGEEVPRGHLECDILSLGFDQPWTI